MKALLLSHKLEDTHKEALLAMLGGKKARRALFVTAATVPYGLDPKPDWLADSLESTAVCTEEVTEIDLEDGSYIPDDLSVFDFVFVSGGNTFYLAHRFNVTGFGEHLKHYLSDGGVYVGSSAGGLILFNSLEPVALADDPGTAPEIVNGLDVLEGVVLPHAESPKHGAVTEQMRLEYQNLGYDVTMIRDDQAFLVDGDRKEII